MCGIIIELGGQVRSNGLQQMSGALRHRGPDDFGEYIDDDVRMAHRRLSIIDLSAAGHQPMASANDRFILVINGEIYNYKELRRELSDYPYVSQTDTEVVLAAFVRWGEKCLEHFRGMFALAIWDKRERRLFAARDRFGVKPLYYHLDEWGTLRLASEIKAFFEAGIKPQADLHAWRQYLGHGLYDHSERTFFEGIGSVPAGCFLRARGSGFEIRRWYDLPSRVLDTYPDTRSDRAVMDEYLALLEENIALRFRSDVAVGVNLSGGFDSSLLLALIHRLQGKNSDISVFTYTSGDPSYDETPWVRLMLNGTRHPWEICQLNCEDIPDLARQITRVEDEPYGGFPTIAADLVFAAANKKGVRVLLDGQGLDEQWAGYDYYAGDPAVPAPTIQGTRTPVTAAKRLAAEFFSPQRHPADDLPQPSGDRILDLRFRDLLKTKIPKALRFNDRVSMHHSCELREPFLDHTLVELALRQPAERLIKDGQGKYLLRKMAQRILPDDIRTAPKRPLHTPQREWLSGPLSQWVEDACRNSALVNAWYLPETASHLITDLRSGVSDNSFALWQMTSLALWEGEYLSDELSVRIRETHGGSR